MGEERTRRPAVFGLDPVRLLVHVEGETEESFVNEVLAPHLLDHGYTRVAARLFGNARQRDRRGGVRSWKTVRGDITKHLAGDSRSFVALMADYYGMPGAGDKAWPGRLDAAKVPHSGKAPSVEALLLDDVAEAMGPKLDKRRFIPLVLMHEFEALLFSDCAAFARGIGRSSLQGKLQAIRDGFTSPEEISDSPNTAPSKRVEGLVPGYQKPLQGTLAALEIGLPTIRAACPHFADWLMRLEQAPRS